jgi:hypothetical protein
MDRFPPVRIIAAMALMTLFSLAWNGLVHGLVLASLNQALVDIGRHTAERSLALGLLLTAGLAALFVASLAATASLDEKARIGWRHGLRHGIFFALGAGLLVDLNQYLLYPLPARVPVAWFGAGLLEFCLAGWLAARVLGAARRGVHAGESGAAVA